MREESAKKEVKDVQVNVGKDLSTATLNGTKIEISPDSNVVVYTNESVQTKPAVTATTAEATEDKQISIGKDFNTVAMYGAKVELDTDGSLIVSTNGKVRIKPAAANDTDGLTVAADGWKCVGISVDTGKPMYVAPADAGLMSWHDATKAAKALQKQGMTDARLPSKGELNQLFNAKAKIGGFNETGSYVGGYYWSSSKYIVYDAWGQRFSDGLQGNGNKDYASSSVRFVRS